MKLKLQYQGQKFGIYAIVLNNGICPAEEFIAEVSRKNPASNRSLADVVKRHADSGQIRNERKSRAIKGRQGLFEFKSRQGDRLLYFYLPGWKTVFTHGFHKGAPEKAEYSRAQTIKDQYLSEVGNGQ